MRVEVERLVQQAAVARRRRAHRSPSARRSASACVARAGPRSRARSPRVGDLHQRRAAPRSARARRARRAARALRARGSARASAGGRPRRGPRGRRPGSRRQRARPGGGRSRRAARPRPGRRARPSPSRAAKRAELHAARGRTGCRSGSSSRGTAAASSSRKSPASHATVAWWSVPIARAVSAAAARSSNAPPAPGKPIVKVVGGSGAARGHRRHDRRRVDPAGEERAVGDVGHHLALDGVVEAARRARRRLASATAPAPGGSR